MNLKRIREVIVVEGRYDKNIVAQIVKATIIETSGFGLFSDKEKLSLLRRLAEKRGVIILTDSDKAGFFIRGRLSGLLGSPGVKHAYIPDVSGTEPRKQSPSKEGKLGVEGMRPEVILLALERAGATYEDEPPPETNNTPITKSDLLSAGLSGEGSAQRRRELKKRLLLPERLSANGLLQVLNALYSRDEFFKLL